MFKWSRYLGEVMEILQMFKGKNSTSCVISLSGTMARPQNSSDTKMCLPLPVSVCISITAHWVGLHSWSKG